MIAIAHARREQLDRALDVATDVRGALDALGTVRREVSRAGDVLARLF